MKLSYEVIELKTRHSFAIARAASVPVRRAVWVRAEDGDGHVGWGEAPVTTPYYGETADTAMAVLPALGDAAIAAMDDNPLALEAAERGAGSAIGGNSAAKTGISAALHDLAGKRLNVPLWKLWGLSDQAPVSSFTIAIDETERMRERVREASDYPILKIKVGTPRDAEILAMIRDEAPDKVLRVDANTAWTTKQAIAALPMMEEYRIELIEQPLPPGDLDGHAALSRVSRIPIAADESCRTSRDIPALAGAFDIINIKLAKCGSLREGIRMVHCARSHGLEVMLGCMIESSLGISAAVQLAPLVDYLDIDGAALLGNDPFHGPGIDGSGSVHFNSAPGLGVTLRDG